MFKKQIFAFLIITAITSIVFAATPSSDDADLQWIEKAIDLTIEDHDIPAIGVAIIKEGKVVRFINKGAMKRGGKSINEKTLFQLGSLSKSFTGMIARALQETGKLDVNKSIIEYLPDSLSEKTRNKLKPITVRDLLHHRSGLMGDSKVIKRKGNDPMLSGYTEAQLLRDLELATFTGKPGEKFGYSNLGFGLLGYILERASGFSYEELLQGFVTGPLKMKATTTVPGDATLIATPYRKENRFIETSRWKMGKLRAAGGIYSNLKDLSKMLIKQMEVLRRADQKSVLNLAVDTRPINDRLDYGWGMFIDNKGEFDHGGDLDGFGTSYTFAPKENVGIVMLTTSGGGIWMPKLENKIISKLRGGNPELPRVRPIIEVSEKELARYSGTYKVPALNLEIVIKQENGKLFAYPKGDFGPRPMSLESKTILYDRTSDAKILFEFDSNGTVKSVKLFIQGNTLAATKVD